MEEEVLRALGASMNQIDLLRDMLGEDQDIIRHCVNGEIMVECVRGIEKAKELTDALKQEVTALQSAIRTEMLAMK